MSCKDVNNSVDYHEIGETSYLPPVLGVLTIYLFIYLIQEKKLRQLIQFEFNLNYESLILEIISINNIKLFTEY